MNPPLKRLPESVDTLLLDLDGTLLDLAYDTHFWFEIVPAHYGATRGLTPKQALESILPRMRASEGTLPWYCLDHWSQVLGMDLAALKRRFPERIGWLPGAREFLDALRTRYPRATLVRQDASRLGALQFFGGELAGAVVSGLPLLSMPPARVRRVLQDAFLRLRPDGAFYQFTYGFRCPVPTRLLERLGLKATRVAIALRNLPPAAVYRIERR
jgi:hypothetical protein